MQTQLTTDAKNGNATVNDFSFTYDDAGNLLSKLDDDITKQTYTYDALNRTASFTDNAVGATTNYIYNYADQRIGKTGATTLTSVWSGGMITLDITNISQPSTNRLYINSGENYGMVVNGSYKPRTANAQGDTAYNTTTFNDIVNFDQYGNQNNGQVLTDESNPYGYRGYYGDVESGNYYLNARYYDPQIQRFTQSDTYRGNNPYAYCGGDPVNRTDPSGHYTVGDKVKAYGYGTADSYGGGAHTRSFNGETLTIAKMVSGNGRTRIYGLSQNGKTGSANVIGWFTEKQFTAGGGKSKLSGSSVTPPTPKPSGGKSSEGSSSSRESSESALTPYEKDLILEMSGSLNLKFEINNEITIKLNEGITVYLGFHKVAFKSVTTPCYHATLYIFVTPSARQYYLYDSNFIEYSSGIKYTTIGGTSSKEGPGKGNPLTGYLVGEFNRPTDLKIATKTEMIKLNITDLDKLFRLVANFNANNSNGTLKYAILATGKQYNSSSFMRGLLNAYGLDIGDRYSATLFWVNQYAGWNKPAPIEYYL
ncbi:MAG: hypothetical protein PHV32_01835 [Eubacteriales bacterium]|nr:hypothetical protein [Eubacteriales bacterium]